MKTTRPIIVATALLALTAGWAAAAELGYRPMPPTPTGSDYVSSGLCITQSLNVVDIADSNSIACNGGGLTFDNSYFRRFDLDGDHGIVTPFAVTSVMFGVEYADGSGDGQPLSVNLYTIAAADPFLLFNLTPIGTATDPAFPDQALSLASLAVSGTVVDPVADDLVVEIFVPNGIADGNSFFIGSNADGQIAPSYLAAADCNVFQPIDIANIGFPDMHIVMEVCSETPTSSDDTSWGTVKGLYR